MLPSHRRILPHPSSGRGRTVRRSAPAGPILVQQRADEVAAHSPEAVLNEHYAGQARRERAAVVAMQLLRPPALVAAACP